MQCKTFCRMPHAAVLGSAHHHPGNVKEAQNRTNRSSFCRLSLAILPNIQQNSECQTTVLIVNQIKFDVTRPESACNPKLILRQCNVRFFAQCLTTRCLVTPPTTILAMPRKHKVEYLSCFPNSSNTVHVSMLPEIIL